MDNIIIDIDGWMSEKELRFLVYVTKDKEGVEIGSWFGRSTINILISCKRLVIVDHFQGSRLSGTKATGLDENKKLVEEMNRKNTTLFQKFLGNLARHDKLYKNKIIELLKMDSIEAAELCKDRRFDFVFIDGSHNYDDAKADIINWLPLIKSSGFIFGHDYTTFQGVKKAVNELFPNKKLPVGSIWFQDIAGAKNV